MSNVKVNKNNWYATTLGDIVKPGRSKVKPSAYPKLPYVGMEHVEANTMRLLGTTPANQLKSAAVHFQPNDVLYGRLRPYLNKVLNPDFEGLCSSEFIAFPPNDKVNQKWLKYLLNSSEFVRFANSLNTGDRPRVDYDQLADYPVRLPSLPEQSEIVEVIETQFTRLDAGVAALKRAQANLKRYRAAVLKAAYFGFNDTDSLPTNWRYATIPELVGKEGVFIDGDWIESKDQDPDGDIRLIQLADIGDGVFRDRSNRFLTNKKALKLNCTFLEENDILVARMPEPLGRACLLPKIVKRSVTAVDICIIRTANKSFNHAWLMHIINTPQYRYNVSKLQSGVTRKRISRRNLGSIKLPVPPISEQKTIVEEVERQFSVMAEMGNALENNYKRTINLRNSILKTAFQLKQK